MFARWGVVVGLLLVPSGAFAQGSAVSAPAPSSHSSTTSRAVTGGAVLFGASYGLMLYFPTRDGFRGPSRWLSVPFVGPALAANAGFEDVTPWGLAFDTVGQAGGATLAVSGFLLGHRYRDHVFVASAARENLSLGLRSSF